MQQVPSDSIKIEIINKKSYFIALILCFFFGYISAHRFYLGKTLSGIIQLLLMWIFSIPTIGFTAIITSIWIFIDFILILMGSFKDKNGESLT